MNEKHEWHEFNEGRVKTDSANNEFISITVESASPKKFPIIYRALIGKEDAIAIAKHFDLIPQENESHPFAEEMQKGFDIMDSIEYAGAK